MRLGTFNKKAETLRRSFEELLSEHLDALYAASLRFCAGSRADAEDLLQDAVLRAFCGFRSLKEADAGRAWLFTILVRTHLNRARSAKRRAEVFAADLDDIAFEVASEQWTPLSLPEELVEQYFFGQRFLSILDTLSVGLRDVVWLIDVEGFRQRDVAEMLEVPEGTVASRLYRARVQIRNALATQMDLQRRERDDP